MKAFFRKLKSLIRYHKKNINNLETVVNNNFKDLQWFDNPIYINEDSQK